MIHIVKHLPTGMIRLAYKRDRSWRVWVGFFLGWYWYSETNIKKII